MYSTIHHSRGETLISVLIGILLLSIVVFGIASLLSNSASLEADTQSQAIRNLLEQNATALIRQADTKGIAEKEVFYLYKNPTSKQFQVFTGSTNIAYAYINARGENITNTGSTQEALFYRSFTL